MSGLDTGDGTDVTKVFDQKFPRPTAIQDIAAERFRQINVEGWTVEHDDRHANHEMAMAAACYADPRPILRTHREGGRCLPVRWPWHSEWWKPSDRRRDLVKAGALIVAEIERLDRASQSS